MLNKKVFISGIVAFTSIKVVKKKRNAILAVGEMIFQKVNHAYRKRPLFLAVVSDGILTFKPDALRTEYVFSHTYPISETSNMLFLEYVFSHTILYLIVALDVM